MKKIQKASVEPVESLSIKHAAILTAATQLFTRYGYRKTTMDDIAETAQVAKRTVYMYFENKAAVFLAILDTLAAQVRQRCAVAEQKDGPPVERLANMLEAYFGMYFELFRESEYENELEATSVEIAQARIEEMNKEYEDRLIRFLQSLARRGETGSAPPGLTMRQIVRVMLLGATAAKHDPRNKGEIKALQQSLHELSAVILAAIRK